MNLSPVVNFRNSPEIAEDGRRGTALAKTLVPVESVLIDIVFELLSAHSDIQNKQNSEEFLISPLQLVCI